MISEYWLLLLKKAEATPRWKAVSKFNVYYDQRFDGDNFDVRFWLFFLRSF